VLSLEVPREELIQRMHKRAEIEGRADDNEEVIQNRFKEYEAKTKPVADFYEKEGKLHKIEGIGAVEEVFVRLTNEIDKIK
jgi:adenylate kinase